MSELRMSTRFARALKKLKNKPREREAVFAVVQMLANDIRLPAKFREHVLSGDRANECECHALPDLLIIFRRRENVIELLDLGSHSDLF